MSAQPSATRNLGFRRSRTGWHMTTLGYDSSSGKLQMVTPSRSGRERPGPDTRQRPSPPRAWQKKVFRTAVPGKLARSSARTDPVRPDHRCRGTLILLRESLGYDCCCDRRPRPNRSTRFDANGLPIECGAQRAVDSAVYNTSGLAHVL